MADSSNLQFTLSLGSFGFKYGEDHGELVFDARFLPNPYYVDSLKPLSGKDKPCADYVFSFPAAVQTLRQLHALICIQAEGFRKQERTSLTVRIGCTGGRHRSVALVEALAKEFADADFTVQVSHRDIDRY